MLLQGDALPGEPNLIGDYVRTTIESGIFIFQFQTKPFRFPYFILLSEMYDLLDGVISVHETTNYGPLGVVICRLNRLVLSSRTQLSELCVEKLYF